jgi:hypothetical protein
MPDNSSPLSPVHETLVKLFMGNGHDASPDSPSESLGAGEVSIPAPPLKPMDPADLRMMLDDGPRAYNDYDEAEAFALIEELEAVVKPDLAKTDGRDLEINLIALNEWFDEREAEAHEAMNNDPNLNPPT